ncbi:hypothetical protein [Paenibacillus thiaminolyticus]|uniref:hypothetical protein n=1 Tax=Paenibacillus thiaminolyticus TaxID=49283 RepID=UPI001F0E345D|nr:hypothetical protein [Paenibacillus thiaminolyticus]
MATIASSLALHDNMTSVLKTITGAMNMTMSTMHDMQSSVGRAFDSSKMDAARKSIQQAEVAIKSLPPPIEQSAKKQKEFNQQIKNGSFNAEDLTKKIMGFIGAYAGFRAVTGMLGSGFEMFKNFEQSMANVRAITNANADEFKALSDEAKRLGENHGVQCFRGCRRDEVSRYGGMGRKCHYRWYAWTTGSCCCGGRRPCSYG